MSRFRLIALGIGSAALVLSAAGCAGGVNANDVGPKPTASAASTTIVISSPGVGQTLHTPYTANGTVPSTVTTDLQVDAVDESGTTICLRTVPAASIAAGTWKAEMSGAIPPKDQLLTIRAYTLDDAGKPQNVTKADFDVSSFSTPAIVIATPACHAALSGASIDATGTSKGVAGQAVLELRDGTGKALAKVNIATIEAAAYSPWTASLAVPAGLAAGYYDLVAYQTGSDGTSVQQEYYVQLVKS